MNIARATTIIVLLVGFVALALPVTTDAVNVQRCCVCKTNPCNGSAATVTGMGADNDAAIAAAGEACDTQCGEAACVLSFAQGACQEAALGVQAGPVIGFTNPICKPGQACTPQIIIGNIIRAVLGIVGSIALLMFIIGGFTWMIAGSAAEKVKKSRDIMIWSGLGLLVIFAAYMIINFIITAVAS